MGTKISYKGNQVGSGNSSGAETIVDKTSLPSSGIENVIYRVTDSVSGETSYHAGNETETETEQLAKYSDVQIIQTETIPSAGASHVGKIYQYIGATNLSYTNGYFYRCVSDGAASPSYSWEEVQVQKIEDATPHWTGTQAEYNAAASGIEDGTIVNITDDYQEGVEVVDVVEEDNEGVPTSAAVYEALQKVGGNDWVECTLSNFLGNSQVGDLKCYYSPSRAIIKFFSYFNLNVTQGTHINNGMSNTLMAITIPSSTDVSNIKAARVAIPICADGAMPFIGANISVNTNNKHNLSVEILPMYMTSGQSFSPWIFLGSTYIG